MTEPRDQPSALPPEQEAVRRLLADARHDGPTPPEVVARLDATLASLAAEREPRHHAPPQRSGRRPRRPAPPDGRRGPAGRGRRRRRRGRPRPGPAPRCRAATTRAPLPAATRPPRRASPAPTPARAPTAAAPAGARRWRRSRRRATWRWTRRLPRAVHRRRRPRRRPGPAPRPTPVPAAASESSRATVCEVPGVGRGRQVVAEIDGALGLVVFRRADGASQQVDLFVVRRPDGRAHAHAARAVTRGSRRGKNAGLRSVEFVVRMTRSPQE